MAIKGITLKNGTGIEYSTENTQLLERIGRIIMTSPLERVNNPLFGSLTETYLFEFPNVLIQNIEFEIRSKIQAYEPNVQVNNVDIIIEKDVANIKVFLTKINSLEPLTLEAYLSI
jgi:phage baseplate assembly protein W